MTQQSEFEKLIEDNECNLKIIRSNYFPLIADGVITGYNLYPRLFDYSGARFFLNYLHSDLKPDDAHFKELSEKLKEAGFLEERTIIGAKAINKDGIIPREAHYHTKPDWKNPENMRYFDFGCNEISLEEARSSERELVGEALQYDWLIKFNSEMELRRVIDIFKQYASKFSLDKQGRKIIKNGKPTYNHEAISEAWDIPLLVCTNIDNQKPRTLTDFLRVNQFNIMMDFEDTSIVLSTLVRNQTKEFQRFLHKHSYDLKPEKKYVIRVFVEEYIDAK